MDTTRKLAQRHRLLRSIRWLFVTALGILSLTILVYMVGLRTHEVQQRAERMRTNFIAEQKELIKREIERVVAHIEYTRSQLDKQAKELARLHALEVHSIAKSLYRQYHQQYEAQTIQGMIIAALPHDHLSKEGGYNFIVDRNSRKVIYHPLPHLIGKCPEEIADVTHQQAHRTILSSLKESEENFVSYAWPENGAGLQETTSYVKRFQPYDWIIGSAISSFEVEQQTKQRLLDEISRVRYGKNGYIFIDDWEGTILMHGVQPSWNGVRLDEIKNPATVRAIQKLIVAAQTGDGDYVSYRWKKPGTTEERSKISFAQGIKEWEWLIGTGVYIDDIEIDIQRMHEDLYAELTKEIIVILAILFLGLVLALLILRVLEKKLRSDIDCFVNFLRHDVLENKGIAVDELNYYELALIAKNANDMLDDKRRAEDSLLKETERLSVTLRSIVDGVVTVDEKGVILFANARAEHLFHTDEGHIIGQSLMDYFRTDPVLSVDDMCAGDFHKTFRADLLSYGEKRLPIEACAQPLTHADGHTVGAVVVMRNVSEQLRAESQRIQISKLESLGVLAGGIAHDFNNLLTGIFGNIELARHHLEGGHPAAKRLDAAVGALHLTTQLTQQLLTFSKGGAPVLRSCNIGETVQQAAELAIHGSRAQLQISMEEGLHCVRVDQGQISQVISNLVINAQQAMDQSGIIDIRVENGGTDELHIHVTDEGSGIPADVIPSIFDPYFTTKEQGNGLGLASSHSIISKHGGSLLVDSREGYGTTFTIVLPVSEQKEDKQGLAAASVSTDSSVRVLIIDDDEMILDMLQQAFSKKGHTAVCCPDSKTAIQGFIQSETEGLSFDVVVTDLTLPGDLGGERIAEELHKINPDVPIVVSSGYANKEILSKYHEHGFCAVVPKPYNPLDLIAVAIEYAQK